MEEIIVIDNYDSFTYNLVHYLEGLDKKVTVFRNDAIDYTKVENIHKIVISPGPGLPKDAGESLSIISNFYKKKSILGICLGHQCIGSFFGHSISNLESVLHGKQGTVNVINDQCLYRGLPQKFNIGHYHSWIVDDKKRSDLIVTARLNSGEIMSIKHKDLPIYGTQFHPESILTDYGKAIIENWLTINE